MRRQGQLELPRRDVGSTIRLAGGMSRRFVVWPHHPDSLGRPVLNGANPSEAQSLTWNVFRTLELMPPAFWLRRLNAALDIDPPRPAPTTARVRLWPRLCVTTDTVGAAARPVEVDVLVETETALWALLVCHAGDVVPDVGPAMDPLAALAAAASWHAGRRHCFAGLVVRSPEEAPLGAAHVRRYRASLGALRLRLPRNAHDVSNVAGFGLTTWSGLTTILRDASHAGTIDGAERAIARRALAWCDRLLCAG